MNSGKPKVWTSADLHFGHEQLCSPVNRHGEPRKFWRPFASAAEMNECIISNWNEDVAPHDKVYVLGDVTMNHKFLPLVEKLNGRKILVKGNHDTADLKEYIKYFKDVRGSALYADAIMTHIPVHPNQFARYAKNIHGHLHERVVMKGIEYAGIPDDRYVCVSLEQFNYRPVLLDSIV